MPVETTYICDNPNCGKREIIKNGNRSPLKGWRTVRLMASPGEINGRGGFLCDACVAVIEPMLINPLTNCEHLEASVVAYNTEDKLGTFKCPSCDATWEEDLPSPEGVTL